MPVYIVLHTLSLLGGPYVQYRCASGQVMSDRLCDAGGYWTGGRLNCHYLHTGGWT